MPLLLDKEVREHTRLAVWKIAEPNEYFIEALGLNATEMQDYSNMRSHRQKEWLSSRYLLHWLSGDRDRRQILKTPTGSPYRNNCNKFISLSHSRDFVAVVISDNKVGIDIQKEESKISRIAHKFISDFEQQLIPKSAKKRSAYQHVFWGSKEAMYKAYGLRELEFKDHMHLYPFKLSKGRTEFCGWVRKNQVHQDYQLYTEKVEDAFLVYALLAKEEIL